MSISLFFFSLISTDITDFWGFAPTILGALPLDPLGALSHPVPIFVCPLTKILDTPGSPTSFVLKARDRGQDHNDYFQ